MTSIIMCELHFYNGKILYNILKKMQALADILPCHLKYMFKVSEDNGLQSGALKM